MSRPQPPPDSGLSTSPVRPPRTIKVYAPDNRVIHFPEMMPAHEIQQQMHALFPPADVPRSESPVAHGTGWEGWKDASRQAMQTLTGLVGLPYDAQIISRPKYGAQEVQLGMLPFLGSGFHGTQNVFDEFSDSAAHAADSLYGPGHYFTDNPKVASEYATGKTPPRLFMDDAQRAEHFTPGRIVKSYGGHDRVIEYDPGSTDRNWSVKVRSVTRTPDGQWIDNPSEPYTRRHATNPMIPPSHAPNVRVAQLDLKNPFNVEEAPDPETVDKLLKHVGGDTKAREAIESAKTNDDLYRALTLFYEYKGDVNRTLRELGYDSIAYPGGKRIVGAEPHQAFVVLSKESIKPPVWAPAKTAAFTMRHNPEAANPWEVVAPGGSVSARFQTAEQAKDFLFERAAPVAGAFGAAGSIGREKQRAAAPSAPPPSSPPR